MNSLSPTIIILLPFQFDNVNACLNILRTHSVGGLESITTNDICSGRLKAVLALFFALSRFKQASKQKSSTTVSGAAGGASTPTKQQLYQQQIQQPSSVNAATAPDMTNRWVENLVISYVNFCAKSYSNRAFGLRYFLSFKFSLNAL